jgi:hypothetical protein
MRRNAARFVFALEAEKMMRKSLGMLICTPWTSTETKVLASLFEQSFCFYTQHCAMLDDSDAQDFIN